MPRRKPPYTHREIARAMFSTSEKNKYPNTSAWLKVEAYNLFMTALPHIIAALVWAGIFGVIYLLIPG